ncbi:hypothetical protein [Schumannella sp. 10F1B-5-1]|uniref:hypothetical protein n=1 Tax=Schumannella sp. 10F1B-5-1 TaxID=2590780 RepID=UPI0011318773|nr:hypothetical protein [Schumannella sp. 10F1B-5-1]TPW73192.1 hypothetical protein FJ658_08130 [Schumannella sp. 10F1B-5-1]
MSIDDTADLHQAGTVRLYRSIVAGDLDTVQVDGRDHLTRRALETQFRRAPKPLPEGQDTIRQHAERIAAEAPPLSDEQRQLTIRAFRSIPDQRAR